MIVPIDIREFLTFALVCIACRSDGIIDRKIVGLSGGRANERRARTFDASLGDSKINGVSLYANELPSGIHAGDTGRPRSHAAVEYSLPRECIGTDQVFDQRDRLLCRVETLLLIEPKNSCWIARAVDVHRLAVVEVSIIGSFLAPSRFVWLETSFLLWMVEGRTVTKHQDAFVVFQRVAICIEKTGPLRLFPDPFCP